MFSRREASLFRRGEDITHLVSRRSSSYQVGPAATTGMKLSDQASTSTTWPPTRLGSHTPMGILHLTDRVSTMHQQTTKR